MALAVKNFGLLPLCFASNLEKKVQSRYAIRCLARRAAFSSDSVKVNAVVNEVSSAAEEREFSSVDLSSVIKEKKREKDDFQEAELEPLWDDGYGSETVKDYLDYAKDIIKPDGGPARWFTPISCGPHLRDSPILLFLPGNLFSNHNSELLRDF